MTIYSRHQLALLLGLVVAAGAGLAIGEWRRANPELSATLEAIDRAGDEDRPLPAPSRSAGPAAAPAPRAAASVSPRPSRSVATEIPAPSGPVDINRASADDLTRLPGIGPVLAARIVAARDARGPFASVDDLRRVSGMGPTKLAALRDLVTISP